MSARRAGLMRYGADWWSVLWVQVTLGLTLVPWIVALPWWGLALLALPVYYLRSSIAYIQHNQGHLAVFWGALPNLCFDLELALLSGYVTPLWELQHSRGHHRHYLTPEHDPASIIEPATGRAMPRWRYCLAGNLTIIRDAWRIATADVASGRADARPRLVSHLVLAGLLALALLLRNPVAFVVMILVPNVVVAWFVWYTSYEHHLELPGTSHYDASHTHLGRGFNLTTFNIGHHAAHHEKPTLHWSLLPARTATLLDRLDPATVHGRPPARIPAGR